MVSNSMNSLILYIKYNWGKQFGVSNSRELIFFLFKREDMHVK